MNEIDDTYKQETEDLDTAFIESHNLGITKESTIKKYLSGIDKSRQKFDNNYRRHLKREKWKILHPKKKKKKRAKIKHLEVKHFNFEFNPFQRFQMKADVTFFNIGRAFTKFFIAVTPRILLYVFYKSTKAVSGSFTDAEIFIEKKKRETIKAIKEFFKNLFTKIKDSIKKSVEKIKKILPKKKAKEGEGDKKEEKTEDKKEDA